MPQNPNKKASKTKEEIFADLGVVEVSPVDQAMLELLVEIRDSLDSMPGNRRLRVMRPRPDVNPDLI